MGSEASMQIFWLPEFLKVETETPEVPAADAPAPAAPAPDAAAAPKREARPHLRGITLPASNEKPILVFFHWPHEDGVRGKQIQRFCRGPLDDVDFVKVSPLFRCVEINTRDSSPALVEEAHVKGTPTLMVCGPDGTIAWRTEDTSMNGKALAAALRKVLQDEFPARWAEVEKEIKAQKEGLRTARELLAKGKDEDAAEALRTIEGSDVRFTDEWTEARKELAEVEKKLKEKEKAAK